MEMLGGMFAVILFSVIGFVFYFVPSFIAWNKRNSGAIIALNILLGWTFIGWVVALVWSLTADQPTVVLMQTPLQQVLPAAPMLCPACGQYSPTASSFCQTCGRSLA
ncbi:MAG TPA: superinfection immunity protein [Candidatus Sulfotelmatobacter sp.]|jgi:hypothetical protein|nr:superinfection immunity protein [Candidatus Sulfotelmatobacter sp.]